MIEDLHFLREVVVDVDAAVVGVGRSRWEAARPGEDAGDVLKRMRSGKFDVFPVDAVPVREYYQTRTWGSYEAVDRKPIEYEDVIPMTTPVRSVISGMAKERRPFYFLESSVGVVGLITVANLNCRQVRTYLFSLISELEMRMGDLLHREYTEDRLLQLKLDKRTTKRFCLDRETGVEALLTEYFYFRDFITSLRTLGLTRSVGYPDSSLFKQHFCDLQDLRNEVAHPSKSLVRHPSEVPDLWGRICRIERALFHIRRELGTTEPS